jgi:hypothetical protein
MKDKKSIQKLKKIVDAPRYEKMIKHAFDCEWEEAIKLIEKYSLDINYQNPDKWTLLLLAAQYNSVEMTEWLINRNVDQTSTCLLGICAYELAKHYDYSGITSILDLPNIKFSNSDFLDNSDAEFLGDNDLSSDPELEC